MSIEIYKYMFYYGIVYPPPLIGNADMLIILFIFCQINNIAIQCETNK